MVFENRIFARYNPKTDTWNIVGHLVTPRQGVTAMVCRNKIYVLGGFDGVERFQSVECFKVKWNGSLQWHHVPNMINCRSIFAACRMENQDIMVIGGSKEDTSVSVNLRAVCKDVEILDITENVWRPGPSLNKAKSALACISVNNQDLEFK